MLYNFGKYLQIFGEIIEVSVRENQIECS